LLEVAFRVKITQKIDLLGSYHACRSRICCLAYVLRLRDLGGSDGVRDNTSMLTARTNVIAVMQELIAARDRIHSHALAFAVMGEHMAMIRLLLENATGDFSDVARREDIE
jgi:hypothetical protein